MRLFDSFKKHKNEKLIKYLQKRISDKSSLGNIIDAFEDMCNIPVKEDIPTEDNMIFEQTVWNEDIEENIFDYIKKSPEYDCCKKKAFSKVEIYSDET